MQEWFKSYRSVPFTFSFEGDIKQAIRSCHIMKNSLESGVLKEILKEADGVAFLTVGRVGVSLCVCVCMHIDRHNGNRESMRKCFIAFTFSKLNINTHTHTHKQFVLTGTFGIGLVMTKDAEGHWSAPAAVAIAGSG